jgi:hypothetical protein
MNITEVIGKKIMHGSPVHENEEVIKQVTLSKELVEIEFESGVFSTMSPGEFEYLIRYKELLYSEMHHGGMSHITFCDSQEKWYSLVD